jgi:hypothetical protein
MKVGGGAPHMNRLDTPLRWTQGIRPASAMRSTPRAPWPEVVWRRLTGRLSGLKPGKTTDGSEDAVGIESSVYFYVGYSHSDFGDAVIVFDGHHSAAVVRTLASPFDTGGIAVGHTPLRPSHDAAARKKLVQRESYPIGEYQARLESWIGSAFPEMLAYVDGAPPSASGVPEIDLETATDERAWRWEGRVVARDLPDAPLVPTALYFRGGDKIEYSNWVLKDSSMSRPEALEHLSLVNRIAEEVGNPVRAAIRSIRGAVT